MENWVCDGVIFFRGAADGLLWTRSTIEVVHFRYFVSERWGSSSPNRWNVNLDFETNVLQTRAKGLFAAMQFEFCFKVSFRVRYGAPYVRNLSYFRVNLHRLTPLCARDRRTLRCSCPGDPVSREWWISPVKQSTTRLRLAWLASVSETCHVELDELPDSNNTKSKKIPKRLLVAFVLFALIRIKHQIARWVIHFSTNQMQIK